MTTTERPSPSLSKLVDPKLLQQMIDEGYIRVQYHPTEPLMILNYTEAAQYDRVWNEATINCRGLIVHTITGEIVARPFPKFFNYGEMSDADKASMVGPIHVTEKLDGSLGITYWMPESKRWAVATRGSFTSEQAMWATKYLHEKLAPKGVATSDGPTEQTALVEIIYPANRIVVDYKGKEALPLLAIIDHETGRNILPDLQAEVGTRINWPDGVVDEHSFGSIMDVLAAPERPNAEGYVVHFLFTDMRVKIKHEEYVRLHKLVTGVTARSIWALLSEGKSLDELLEHVPDEFYQWVEKTATDLNAKVAQLMFDWGVQMGEILKELSERGINHEDVFRSKEARKEFAELAKKYPNPGVHFAALDGKDIARIAWAEVKPAHERPFHQVQEAS